MFGMISVDEILKSQSGELNVLALRQGAKLCELSYAPTAPTVEGFESFAFANDNAEFFCLKSDKAIFLCFRGTDSKADALKADANFHLIPFHGGLAHEGYVKHWMKCKSKVMRLIRDAKPDVSLYWLGHSLGASTAVMGITDIYLEGMRKPAGVYLYGCPRPSNEAFAKAWDDNFSGVTWSCINRADIVPVAGRKGMKNIGRIVRINHAFQAVTTPQTLAQRIKERLVNLFLSGDAKQSINSHLMSSYIESLGKICEHAKPL